MLLYRENFEKILGKEFPVIYNDIRKQALIKTENKDLSRKKLLK